MLFILVLPAFVLAQQPAPNVPAAPAGPAAPAVPAAPAAPTAPASSQLEPASAPPAMPVQTERATKSPSIIGGFAPLPNVELPADMVRPPASATATLPPPAALPQAPQGKLTPSQIAAQIAPNFNVTRDYVRLTQCYGTADFMGAVTRIQASRPGATAQVVGVARSIAALQDGMQPMVLAASTVRGEARFRADYDAIARRGQNELATSRTPNTTMQRRLATLDACRADVIRWRGQR